MSILVHIQSGCKRIPPQAGRWGWAALAVLSLAAVGAALVSQHHYDMQPCPWCIIQRLLFLVFVLPCTLGAVSGRAGAQWTAAASAALVSGLGIAAAIWQHTVAAASASCNLTLADQFLLALQLPQTLPEIFEPRASCAEAGIALLGLPYPLWSLALFVLLGLGAVLCGWSVRKDTTRNFADKPRPQES
jgi:disulfide bond formation protein DsbB